MEAGTTSHDRRLEVLLYRSAVMNSPVRVVELRNNGVESSGRKRRLLVLCLAIFRNIQRTTFLFYETLYTTGILILGVETVLTRGCLPFTKDWDMLLTIECRKQIRN